MAYYFNIEEYFQDLDKNISFSKYDKEKIIELRKTINSFMYEGDQYEFIYKWRSIKSNRDWDYYIFGIGKTAVLNKIYADSKKSNTNYYFHRSNIDRYSNINKNDKKIHFKLITMIKAMKIQIIILSVFLIISAIVYTLGFPRGKLGRTPFETCSDKNIELDNIMNSDAFSKIRKDGSGDFKKIPANVFEYDRYEEARSDPELFLYSENLDESKDFIRGIGKLSRSSFPGTDTETNSDYVISMRWEYSPFRVRSAVGSDQPYNDDIVPWIEINGELVQNIDIPYYNWISDQKILIYNRETNKAVICQVAIPSLMEPIYSISNSDTIGSITDITMDYLEFDGENKLDIFWVNVENPEDVPTGPYLGYLSSDEIGCEKLSGGIVNLGGLAGGIGGSLTADMSSMANLAVSLAYERKNESKGNDGTMVYKMLADQYAPGIRNLTRSCASAISIIVRASGVDSNFIETAGVSPMKTYINRSGSNKWKFIGSPKEGDLLPGDILFSTTSSHVWMYVGSEAVKSVYPNSSGNTVQASYNYTNYNKAYSAHIISYNYKGSGYIAYRLIN